MSIYALCLECSTSFPQLNKSQSKLYHHISFTVRHVGKNSKLEVKCTI